MRMRAWEGVLAGRPYACALTTVSMTLTIPGATQKFTGLQQLSETYTRTPESKYINVQHFMRGLQDKMTNDQDFVQSVLRNGSRSYQKV